MAQFLRALVITAPHATHQPGAAGPDILTSTLSQPCHPCILQSHCSQSVCRDQL